MGNAQEPSAAENRSKTGFSQVLSHRRRRQKGDGTSRNQGTRGPERTTGFVARAKVECRSFVHAFAQLESGCMATGYRGFRQSGQALPGNDFTESRIGLCNPLLFCWLLQPAISPRFGEGSGLKQAGICSPFLDSRISPRFGEGSGLKLPLRLFIPFGERSPLASVRGAD